MTSLPYARYRIVELDRTDFQVQWLIGRRWTNVWDADTLADARRWLIARIADAERAA